METKHQKYWDKLIQTHLRNLPSFSMFKAILNLPARECRFKQRMLVEICFYLYWIYCCHIELVITDKTFGFIFCQVTVKCNSFVIESYISEKNIHFWNFDPMIRKERIITYFFLFVTLKVLILIWSLLFFSITWWLITLAYIKLWKKN